MKYCEDCCSYTCDCHLKGEIDSLRERITSIEYVVKLQQAEIEDLENIIEEMENK